MYSVLFVIYPVYYTHPSISCPSFSLTLGNMDAVALYSRLKPLFHWAKNSIETH